jgi:hypothetical protein
VRSCRTFKLHRMGAGPYTILISNVIITTTTTTTMPL